MFEGLRGPEIQRVEDFDASAADVYAALREAPTMINRLSVTGVDASSRTAFIRGALTATTWGQRYTATVTARGDESQLRLIGKANFYSYTAKRRINQVHQELIDAIRTKLTRQQMR